MVTLEGNPTLKQVVERGFEEIRQGFLEQLKKAMEGLLEGEEDRRVAAFRQRGRKVYRWRWECVRTGAFACGTRRRGGRAVSQ